jgi:hypothetical protein
MSKRVSPEPTPKAPSKAPSKEPSKPAPDPFWSVPIGVDEVPETGRRVDLAADAPTREAIAKAAGLAALPRLEASFDLTRLGADGLSVSGRVSATVVQNCVVTLEPLESQIDEAIDLVFVPHVEAAPDPSGLLPVDAGDPPEPLREGVADLGAVATEFLLLGIDPYPRKPGAVFDAPPAGDPASHPFAALAALKKRGDSKDS